GASERLLDPSLHSEPERQGTAQLRSGSFRSGSCAEHQVSAMDLPFNERLGIISNVPYSGIRILSESLGGMSRG
ncbi:hypothetical protein, partial [Novosphingobium sediminis]|uniref:hypothetical protein n=1 Tax=Novosphingobium sediminis TaxID=707214 RepID=UPI001C3FC80A